MKSKLNGDSMLRACFCFFYLIGAFFLISSLYGCAKENVIETEYSWPEQLDKSHLIGTWVKQNADIQGQKSHDILILDQDGTWLTAQAWGASENFNRIEYLQQGSEWDLGIRTQDGLPIGTSINISRTDGGAGVSGNRSISLVYVDEQNLIFGSNLTAISIPMHYQRSVLSKQEVLKLLPN